MRGGSRHKRSGNKKNDFFVAAFAFAVPEERVCARAMVRESTVACAVARDMIRSNYPAGVVLRELVSRMSSHSLCSFLCGEDAPSGRSLLVECVLSGNAQHAASLSDIGVDCMHFGSSSEVCALIIAVRACDVETCGALVASCARQGSGRGLLAYSICARNGLAPPFRLANVDGDDDGTIEWAAAMDDPRLLSRRAHPSMIGRVHAMCLACRSDSCLEMMHSRSAYIAFAFSVPSAACRAAPCGPARAAVAARVLPLLESDDAQGVMAAVREERWSAWRVFEDAIGTPLSAQTEDRFDSLLSLCVLKRAGRCAQALLGGRPRAPVLGYGAAFLAVCCCRTEGDARLAISVCSRDDLEMRGARGETVIGEMCHRGWMQAAMGACDVVVAAANGKVYSIRGYSADGAMQAAAERRDGGAVLLSLLGASKKSSLPENFIRFVERLLVRSALRGACESFELVAAFVKTRVSRQSGADLLSRVARSLLLNECQEAASPGATTDMEYRTSLLHRCGWKFDIECLSRVCESAEVRDDTACRAVERWLRGGGEARPREADALALACARSSKCACYWSICARCARPSGYHDLCAAVAMRGGGGGGPTGSARVALVRSMLRMGVHPVPPAIASWACGDPSRALPAHVFVGLRSSLHAWKEPCFGLCVAQHLDDDCVFMVLASLSAPQLRAALLCRPPGAAAPLMVILGRNLSRSIAFICGADAELIRDACSSGLPSICDAAGFWACVRSNVRDAAALSAIRRCCEGPPAAPAAPVNGEKRQGPADACDDFDTILVSDH